MGPDSDGWIVVKGKRVNKVDKNSHIIDNHISVVQSSKFKALSTYTEDTPDPPQRDHTPADVIKARQRLRKKPTQKHVKHTLRLLAQQESAFLDMSILRAENEATDLAKRDTTNPKRCSIEANHRLSQAEQSWKQSTKQAWSNVSSKLNQMAKQLKRTNSTQKTVRFAPTRSVRRYLAEQTAAMITYDSGADGHYLSERDRALVGLPILRPSSKRVGVANGGSSKAKHVTALPFKHLSAKANRADSFEDFPNSLMSVGKTADDGTISIFSKDGVTVHKEEDVLITCKGEPILIGVRDEHGRYRIPLQQQQRGQWQPRRPSKRHGKCYVKPTVCMTCPPSNRQSNGCTQYAAIQ